MLNEFLAIGTISAEIEESTTKSGAQMVQTRIEIIEHSSGRPWRTWVPAVGYGFGARRLLEFETGSAIVLRGKIGWSKDAGLVVVVHSVSPFAVPADLEAVDDVA